MSNCKYYEEENLGNYNEEFVNHCGDIHYKILFDDNHHYSIFKYCPVCGERM